MHGEDSTDCMQIYDWFQCLQGRHEGESDERSERLTISNVELVRESRRIIIRKLFDEFSISFGLVESILCGDMGMKDVSAKCVLKVLTAFKKDAHVSAPQGPIECTNNYETFINTIITGNEH